MPEPWSGKDYGGARLLLLGESAYSWIEDGQVVDPSPRHCIELVDEVIEKFPTNPFMTKLSRALASEEWPTKAQVESGWARSAFANYIQTTVGLGARIRPTDDMWQEAKQQFPILLETLRPKNIIVLGKGMWSRMPETDLHLTDDVQGYKLSNGEMAVCWAVNHPSAGLSWRGLAALIQFAIGKG